MRKLAARLLGATAVLCLFVCAACAATEAVGALELYNGDPEEQKSAYADRPVVVKGIATYVGPDQFGLPAVNLSDSAEGKTYVLCVLPFNDFFKLGDVRVGQEITFSGELRGRAGEEGFIVLKQCRIVED